MFVSCDKCGYDSGDYTANESIAQKVESDGGSMMLAYDENGKPKGWDITCPNGHSGESIHID
jgi:hypothetical protein